MADGTAPAQLPATVWTQGNGAAQAVAAPVVPGVKGPATNTPDLSAIYYYSRNNDLPRVAAEIRRLQTLYPNWVPPDDIFSQKSASTVDEQPLWDLYQAKDFAGIEAMIGSLRTANPDWSPSQDFQAKYQLALLRQKIVAASDANDYGAVVALAAPHSETTSCADPDLAWRIAEANARVSNLDKAIEIYKLLVTSCKGAPERLATAQKASVVIADYVALDTILALGQTKPDGHNEFEAVRLDLVRRRVGDFASGKSTEEPTPIELTSLQRQAKTTSSANDMQLLGWFYRKKGDKQQALDWFQLAVAREASAKNAEGLALSLREIGKVAQAEDLSYQWHDKSPQMRDLYIEIVSSELTSPTATPPVALRKAPEQDASVVVAANSPFALPQDRAQSPSDRAEPITIEKLTRFKVEVEAAKSALGAQSMGWFLYNSGEIQASAFWFQKSIGWRENEEGVVGLAVAAKRMKNEQAYRVIVSRYGRSYPKLLAQDQRKPSTIASLLPEGASVAMIERNQADELQDNGKRDRHGKKQHNVDAYTRHSPTRADSASSGEAIAKDLDDGKYDDVIKKVSEQTKNSKVDPGLKVLQAWAMYHKGDWDGAKAKFEEAKTDGKTKESAEGLRVINERIYPVRR
jgi:tetratricopeptide (TPR) repeat protein